MFSLRLNSEVLFQLSLASQTPEEIFFRISRVLRLIKASTRDVWGPLGSPAHSWGLSRDSLSIQDLLWSHSGSPSISHLACVSSRWGDRRVCWPYLSQSHFERNSMSEATLEKGPETTYTVDKEVELWELPSSLLWSLWGWQGKSQKHRLWGAITCIDSLFSRFYIQSVDLRLLAGTEGVAAVCWTGTAYSLKGFELICKDSIYSDKSAI